MIKYQCSVWSILYKNHVYNYDDAQWHIFMWYRRIFSLVIRPMLINCYMIYFTNIFFSKSASCAGNDMTRRYTVSHWERSSYSMQFTGLNKHHVIRYLMLNQWTVNETLSFLFKPSQCYFQTRSRFSRTRRRCHITPNHIKTKFYPLRIYLGTEWSGWLVVIARVGVKTAWRAKVKKLVGFKYVLVSTRNNGINVPGRSLQLHVQIGILRNSVIYEKNEINEGEYINYNYIYLFTNRVWHQCCHTLLC